MIPYSLQNETKAITFSKGYLKTGNATFNLLEFFKMLLKWQGVEI